MAKIIIVEDDLKAGFELANQFKELSAKGNDIDATVECICYFDADRKAQRIVEDAKKNKDLEFDIKWVTLFDFREVLDEYFYCEDEDYIIVSKSALENDGSDYVPCCRVNYRWARRKMDAGKIFMYSRGFAGSISYYNDNNFLVCELGSEFIIDVYSESPLSLWIESNEYLMNKIRKPNDDLTLNYKTKN